MEVKYSQRNSSSWSVIFNRIGKGPSTPRCMTSWLVAIHIRHLRMSSTSSVRGRNSLSMQESSLSMSLIHMPYGASSSSDAEEKWTIQESLTICRHLHGKYLSTSDYNRIRKEHPEMPSRATIVNKHGSWAEALRHHGLTPHSRFTDDECLDFLRTALSAREGALNSVEYDRWAIENGAPRLLALTKRFGSWPGALAKARATSD